MRAAATRRLAAELPVTESQLQSAVLELCNWSGVLAYHTHDSRRSQPGFPDLVIAGVRGVLFRELKTATGRLSQAQAQWSTMLRLSGADWAVWRPEDLRGGRVQREIERVR